MTQPMDWTPASVVRWLFDSERGASERLLARWLFLRALGLIHFSAFYSLAFQIRGLIGQNGILPSNEYLAAVARSMSGALHYWYAPTLLWWSTGPHMLMALCWTGMAASVLLVLNVWPRATLLICFVCFLSFVSAAEDFSGYQSDGMLLEATFIALFFAPRGIRPGIGALHPSLRASLFLLQWEWFRIYFESGMVKLASGDPQWRHLTAMDEYYQNGPLPTWIGWYAQHLPHWFHVGSAGATLVLELGLVWMLFMGRRWRIVCFFIVTPWEIGVILTANYTFLNYLVLALGFLLLDDEFLLQWLREKWSTRIPTMKSAVRQPLASAVGTDAGAASGDAQSASAPRTSLRRNWRAQVSRLKLALSAAVLTLVFYVTVVQMIPRLPLPTWPVTALDPFRIANRYGLFAVMTRGRYEIEFQGSNDGQNWTAYPFRYKPQDPSKPPGIYAPYQPRFDWNLWFASLGSWREYPIVPSTEERLLANDRDVLALFANNPFSQAPPRQVRAVLWQYWFTSLSEKRATGLWWNRRLLGLYAPTLLRTPDGKLQVLGWPSLPPRM